MNLKTIVITGIMLFSIATLVYSPIANSYAQDTPPPSDGVKDVYIVNNLDVPLVFNEIKNREHIEIKSSPPETVESGETKSFKIEEGNEVGPYHLNIKYFVNDAGSGEEVGIVYKQTTGESHCPKDHPDDITEEVDHCGSFDNNKEWRYIFSPK